MLVQKFDLYSKYMHLQTKFLSIIKQEKKPKYHLVIRPTSEFSTR